MTQFLKIGVIALVVVFAYVQRGHAAASADQSEYIPVGVRLKSAPNLEQVLKLGSEAYEIQRKTWNLLRGEKDVEATQRAVEALKVLRENIVLRCCAITGLTADWGNPDLRISRHFFTETSELYNQLKVRIEGAWDGKKSHKSEEEGKEFGSLHALVEQRITFYSSVFDLLSADPKSFTETGAGARAKALLGSTFYLGDYRTSSNRFLALLVVEPEEEATAAKLAELLSQFHEPLGITDSVQYRYLGETLTAKQKLLQLSLPRETAQQLLAHEDPLKLWHELSVATKK